MGIPKLLFLNKLISKSSFQSLKPHFITRKITQYSTQFDNSLHSKIVQLLANSPKTSVIPLLSEYEKGTIVKHSEIKRIIHTLRQKHLFDRALEVSEWITGRSIGPPVFGDLAVRLDLTGQVHGVEAAERLFNDVNDHSERMYGALLSCYVKANLVDKSLSHFQTMKDKGIITNALAYNNIMTLYMKTGEVDKVPKLLFQMEEDGVTPDIISYKICLKSLALKSDTAVLEKMLNMMETKRGPTIDWSTCCLVADYFINEGCKEKAVCYLQKAENRVRGNPIGIKHLITLYAKLGDSAQIMSLWRIHKQVCKAQINVDYMVVISSLVKVDEIEEAERVLHEWESSGNSYDFRVVNVLLLGYSRKGMVEKGERLVEDVISKGKSPIPSTWTIISGGHIKCGNMGKALERMKKGLELGPEYEGWVPNQETVSSILKWLGDEGGMEEVDGFLEVLCKVVPMNQEMYSTLIRANVRHGKDIGEILERMKADNVDADEETSKLIK